MPVSKAIPNAPARVRPTPAEIPSFVAMDMMREANALAAAGRSVIHLETGQPSTAAPAAVRDAAAHALNTEMLGYTEALGLRPLRERIARYYADQHGLEIDPARIVATTGSSAGLMLAFLALAGPGGRIGMARPYYPCYRNIALALGMEPVEIPLTPESGFELTPAALDSADKEFDLLLIASPANPTGIVLSRERLSAIGDWCRAAQIPLVADEVYHGLTYGAPAPTVLSADPNAIALNGFSKYYSMTGWRLGWMVAPQSRMRQLECLAQNLYIAPPSLSQHAAIAAFDATDELAVNLSRYAANRALLLEALPRLGFQIPAAPGGAFYIYARLPPGHSDSTAFARQMLAETGVAATPGVDFDRVEGQGFIRFSYAGGTEEVVEAIRRLDDWLSVRGRRN